MTKFVDLVKEFEDQECVFCKNKASFRDCGDCDRRGSFIVYGCFSKNCPVNPQSKEFDYNQYINSEVEMKRAFCDSYKNWKETFGKLQVKVD